MNPLLENDKVLCGHNGQVQLKANIGKNLEVKGVPVITKSDLMSASIIGCSNNILGVPNPCTSIPMVPPNVLSQSLSVGGEGVVPPASGKTYLDYSYKLKAIFPDRYKDKLKWGYKVIKSSDCSSSKGGNVDGIKVIDNNEAIIEIVPSRDLNLSDEDKDNILKKRKDYKLAFFGYLNEHQEKPIYESKYGKTHYCISFSYPEITKEMLRKVFTGVKDRDTDKNRILQEIADELNRLNNKGVPMYVTYKLDTKKRLDHFFAQCAHEASFAGQFIMEEQLNYTPEALIDKFKYFKDTKNQHEARKYGRIDAKNKDRYPKETLHPANKAEIAKRLYSGRMGNKSIANENHHSAEYSDGWRFRGRGLIQLTGYNNYNEFNQALQQSGNEYGDFSAYNFGARNKLGDDSRDLICIKGKLGLLSAVYFWKDKKLFDFADQDDGSEGTVTHTNSKTKETTIYKEINYQLDEITHIINGGYNGLEDRQENFKRIHDEQIFIAFD